MLLTTEQKDAFIGLLHDHEHIKLRAIEHPEFGRLLEIDSGHRDKEGELANNLWSEVNNISPGEEITVGIKLSEDGNPEYYEIKGRFPELGFKTTIGEMLDNPVAVAKAVTDATLLAEESNETTEAATTADEANVEPTADKPLSAFDQLKGAAKKEQLAAAANATPPGGDPEDEPTVETKVDEGFHGAQSQLTNPASETKPKGAMPPNNTLPEKDEPIENKEEPRKDDGEPNKDKRGTSTTNNPPPTDNPNDKNKQNGQKQPENANGGGGSVAAAALSNLGHAFKTGAIGLKDIAKSQYEARKAAAESEDVTFDANAYDATTKEWLTLAKDMNEFDPKGKPDQQIEAKLSEFAKRKEALAGENGKNLKNVDPEVAGALDAAAKGLKEKLTPDQQRKFSKFLKKIMDLIRMLFRKVFGGASTAAAKEASAKGPAILQKLKEVGVSDVLAGLSYKVAQREEAELKASNSNDNITDNTDDNVTAAASDDATNETSETNVEQQDIVAQDDNPPTYDDIHEDDDVNIDNDRTAPAPA